MKLGAVVPCTNSKSGPTVHAAARNIDHDLPIPEAADRWRSRLTTAPQSNIARGLYKGPGWVASLRLVDALQATGAEVSWRIISAGYGLLHPEEQVTTYSATFLAGHADSVPGAASGANASLTWWNEVNRLRGQAQPLVRLASEVNGLVVTASAPYIDAIAAELTAAAQQVPTVVFCAGRPQDRTVAELAPRFDRRLREGADPFVRGGDVGFNQRVAAKVVDLLGPAVLDRVRVDEVLALAMDRAGPVRYGRQVASDATVMAFIDAALKADPSSSRTALLRRWRDRGRACEQSRFGALYERVVAERSRQLAFGEAACG
jgi:hypothetical protein